MDLLAQLFVNGLINGSHYALLGAGFGLIFATTRIVHFAYGPIFTAAAYAAWFAANVLGLPIACRHALRGSGRRRSRRHHLSISLSAFRAAPKLFACDTDCLARPVHRAGKPDRHHFRYRRARSRRLPIRHLSVGPVYFSSVQLWPGGHHGRTDHVTRRLSCPHSPRQSRSGHHRQSGDGAHHRHRHGEGVTAGLRYRFGAVRPFPQC